jgi:Domain of unknown function (DUF5666)
MTRRIVLILAMIAACAGLAVVGAHAASWSGPAGTPVVGSNLQSSATYDSQSPSASGSISAPSSDSQSPNTAGSVSAPSGTQPADEPGEAQDPSQDAAQENDLTGSVASVDTANSLLKLTTAQGTVTVQVTGQTLYEDGVASLASLQNGASVSVEGTPQANGQIVAAEIHGTTDGADASDNNAAPDGQSAPDSASSNSND